MSNKESSFEEKLQYYREQYSPSSDSRFLIYIGWGVLTLSFISGLLFQDLSLNNVSIYFLPTGGAILTIFAVLYQLVWEQARSSLTSDLLLNFGRLTFEGEEIVYAPEVALKQEDKDKILGILLQEFNASHINALPLIVVGTIVWAIGDWVMALMWDLIKCLTS